MSRRRMREKDAIILAGALALALLLLTSLFWVPMIWNGPASTVTPQAASGTAVSQNDTGENKEVQETEELPVVDETGLTLETRIHPASGYQRVSAETGSLSEFLRTYSLKKAAGTVKTYSGEKVDDQTGVQAVFTLPLEKVDLQRSAGTVMRVYAEYLWSKKAYDKISFQLNDGFQAELAKWQQGFRIRMDATGAIWVNGGTEDESEESFKEYMKKVLTYTSADSLKKETKKISLTELAVGDVFLQTGTDADAAMVVDVCENEQGEKAFLLAKGGKPAQQFHLLKNPAHEDDPWYYETELTDLLSTPEAAFKISSLRHPTYLDEEIG